MVRAPYPSAVIAVLVHVLVIAALPRARPAAPIADAPAIEPIELETSIDPQPADTPHAAEPASPATDDARLAVHVPAPQPSGGGASSSAPAASGEPSGAPDVAPAPGGSATFTMPRSLSPAELGLASGGPNPFATSPGFAPPSSSSSEAPRPAAERALRDALRASDRIVGLGPEGPAVTALREATSSSLAPLNGRARFTIRAGENGEVLGIDLLDATGGTGWDDAKRLALEALRSKKLVLPRGAKGANIHVEIVSELSYPSGQKSGLELGLRPGAVVLPDESNIGQRPTRKIHARATGTEVF
jgi:hypothetical protein